MKQEIKKKSSAEIDDPDAGEERLAELIHEAGEAARAEHSDEIKRHFDRIRKIVDEAASRWEDAEPR